MAVVTAMLGSAPITVTVHTGLKGLEEIRDAWRQAAAGMERRHYFHDIRWYQAYLEVSEPDPQSVHFLVFRKAGTPMAVIPLRRATIKRRGIPVRVLELPQHRYLSEGDFVIADEVELAGLARAFLTRLGADTQFGWDVLRLPDILDDARALALLACMKGYLRHTAAKGGCNYLECPTGKNNLAGISKNLRAVLRNSKNRLDALGVSRFVEYRRGPELHRAYDQFLALESGGWKGRMGSAITSTEGMDRIYRRRVELFAATDQVSVTLLLLGEQPVAGALCFDVDDTRYFFKIARDEAFNRVAPGHLMLEHLVRTCTADEKVRVLNLVSDAEWPRSWHPAQQKAFNCSLCNWTLGGLVEFAALTRAGWRSRQVSKQNA